MKKLSLLFAAATLCFVVWGVRNYPEEQAINRLGGTVYYDGNNPSPFEWLEKRIGIRCRSNPVLVEFRSDTIGDDEFARLKFSGIRSLRLEDCPSLTARTARKIASLDDLEEIYVPTANVDDEWIAELAKLPRLEMLNIRNSSVSDRSAAALKSMPGLKFLSVANSRITSSGLLEILDAPALESLYISSAQWRPELSTKQHSKGTVELTIAD